MNTTFQIPRQSDRELVKALSEVRKSVRSSIQLSLAVGLPKAGEVILTEDAPENGEQLKYIFDAESDVLGYVYLRDSQNRALVQVQRSFERISDTVTLPDEAWNQLDNRTRSQVWVSVLASVRKELKAADIEAALKGVEDNSWNRYRDAQLTILSSLEQTAQRLITDVSKNAAEAEKARATRFEKLETDLRAELAEQRKSLQLENDAKKEALTSQEKALSEREAGFNTKEARYVARQKQDEQIKQINDWLDKWKLTTGTEEKRRPIFRAYVTALILTGLLTLVAFGHNYWIARSAADLSKLEWWHWVLLTLKALFPLAAFSTFIVYFIRWSSAWARQHSEEEFRNRTRVIDIGRSSWLLEAVRDAQDRNKELPPELLQELSRNLFSNPASTETDIHPQAVSDVLLQGLSSIRVKSPSGAELEAKRGKTDK